MSDDIYELSAAIGKDVEEIYSKVQAQIQLGMCYEDLPICKMLLLLIKIKNETPELFEPALLFFANSTASFRTIALKYEIPPVTFWRKVKRLASIYPEIDRLLKLRQICRQQIRKEKRKNERY